MSFIINDYVIDTTSFKGTTNNSKHACVYCKDIILNDTLLSEIQLQILYHVVLLFFNGPVQTCSACIVFVKPVLTKSWNEVLDHIKVAVSSSKV